MTQANLVRSDGTKTDPVRTREKRVLAQVESVPAIHVTHSGVALYAGKTLIVMYERDFKKIDQDVEDLGPEAFRVAQQRADQSFRDWLGQHGLTGPSSTHNWDTCPFSMERGFREIYGRGPKPIRDIKVLAELPPPDRESVMDGTPAVGSGEDAVLIAQLHDITVIGDSDEGWIAEAPKKTKAS